MTAGDAVRVVFNGEGAEVGSGWTLRDLLDDRGLDPRAVAVERNGEIVPRGRYDEIVLEAGDQLEVVRFVQGG